MLLALVYALEVALALLVVVLTARTALLSRRHADRKIREHHYPRQARQRAFESTKDLAERNNQGSSELRSVQSTLTDYISETLTTSNEPSHLIAKPAQDKAEKVLPGNRASNTTTSQHFIDQTLSIRA